MNSTRKTWITANSNNPRRRRDDRSGNRDIDNGRGRDGRRMLTSGHIGRHPRRHHKQLLGPLCQRRVRLSISVLRHDVLPSVSGRRRGARRHVLGSVDGAELHLLVAVLEVCALRVRGTAQDLLGVALRLGLAVPVLRRVGTVQLGPSETPTRLSSRLVQRLKLPNTWNCLRLRLLLITNQGNVKSDRHQQYVE